MNYGQLAFLENILSTSTLGWDERKEILKALLLADEVEIEYITHYLKNNQQNLVQEGKASQKEITQHIKTICGL